MIRKPLFRYLLGIILGGLSGMSFCISILPVALSMAGAGDQDYLGIILTQYTLYTALVWAAGGFSVARAGFLKAGMVIMALVGMITGGLLVATAIRANPAFLAAGILGGLVYGLVGGMILGRVLEKPMD